MSVRHAITTEQIAAFQKNISSLIPALELLDIQIVITDPNANILFINQAGQRILGYSARDAVGQTPGDLWGGHESKEIFEKMWKTIKEDKQTFVGQVKNLRKDGQMINQEIHISPLLDEKGEIKYFIAAEPELRVEKVETSDSKRQITNLINEAISRELKIAALKDEIKLLKSKT